MNFIHNLLINLINLIFLAMDILMVMILIKVIYRRWHPEFLRSINLAIEPVIYFFTDYIEAGLSKMTGKRYSERILLMLLIVGLTVIRLVICALVSS
jgi:hypothetical protein